MAKPFLLFAILFTLVTATFAFLTKGKVNVLTDNLHQTKATLATTEKTLSKSQADLKKSNEDLTAANTVVADQKTQIGTITQDRDDQKKKADDATAQIADKDMKIADLTKSINDMKTALGGAGAEDPKVLQSQIETMKTQLASATAAADEQKALAASYAEKMKADEAKVQSTTSELKHYQQDIALHAFAGRVEAVNPGWNFVVLNVGDRQGATIGSQLVVTRNGVNIGKVKITSVEPSTSIADVIPGSMPKGQAVQPGDQVVFAGNRGSNRLPGSSRAPAPGGATQQNNSQPLPE